jgi:hypothetical protein
MRYRHSQVLELAGVSKDTIRYWKLHLAPLQRKDGRSQHYTFAEILAIAAIADAVSVFNVGVERLAPIADRIFELAAKAIELGREPGVLCLKAASVEWRPQPPHVVDACTLILPLEPLIRRLRARIANSAHNVPPAQYELPLPERIVIGLPRNR